MYKTFICDLNAIWTLPVSHFSLALTLYDMLEHFLAVQVLSNSLLASLGLIFFVGWDMQGDFKLSMGGVNGQRGGDKWAMSGQ